MNNNAFTGKVCVVTGAASGIGRSVARTLVKHGGSVVVADLDETGANDVAKLLGDAATGVGCDVSDEQQVIAMLGAAVDRFGGIDVLVNNAGLDVSGTLLELDGATFERVLAINLLGPFYGIKHAVPHLTKRGGGSIVSTASIAGLRGAAMMGAYGASKAALISLTQTAALELRQTGIRVNCVCPGIIDTPLLARQLEPLKSLGVDFDEMTERVQGRMGKPEDIARAIAYLASDDSDLVSGLVMPVDNAMSVALDG